MKNKENLIKDKVYQIRYTAGPFDYNNYSDTGIYTGEIDDIDGEVFGFKIAEEKDTCYFPLDSIFEDN